MTLNEILILIKKRHPDLSIAEMLETEKFYIFRLVPIGVKHSDNYQSGPYMNVIDRKTGSEYIWDITSNPELYLSAKPINF